MTCEEGTAHAKAQGSVSGSQWAKGQELEVFHYGQAFTFHHEQMSI